MIPQDTEKRCRKPLFAYKRTAVLLMRLWFSSMLAAVLTAGVTLAMIMTIVMV